VERSAAQLLLQISDAVAVVRLEDGLVVDVNQALLAMTGYQAEDLIGRSSHDLVIWATVGGQLETVAGLRELRSVSEAPAGFRTRAGELRVGDLSVLVVGLEGRRHGVCALRAGRDPTAAERRAVARLELGRILRGGGPWLRLAEAAVRVIGECLRWELGAVWRLDPEAGILRCAHVRSAPAGRPQELAPGWGEATIRAGEGLLGRVLRTGEAAWVPDALRDGDVMGTRSGAAARVHGWFAVPVHGQGEALGVLELGSREVRHRDQAVLDIVLRFASRLGRVAAGGAPTDPEGASALGLELQQDPLLLQELAHSVGRLNRLLEGIVELDRPGPQPTGPAPAPGNGTEAAGGGEGLGLPAGLTLKAVSERTGVPAATVRTWERRYGFLRPARSSSGYRLYGEDDIRKVLEVRRLLEHGVRISEAMAAVRGRPKGGDDRQAALRPQG
jgi:PAS domain S-box-containing protein